MYPKTFRRFYKPFIFTFAFSLAFSCNVLCGITEEYLIRNLDLSGFTEPQKGIILKETIVYAKTIAPLYHADKDYYHTDNEAWRKKVEEMLYQLREGFRIYKFSRDPRIEAAIRDFDSTAKAKVYLLSYVEDAFFNNLFLRLAEAYYENSRPEQYIIFKYRYSKSPASTFENPLYIPATPLIEIAKPLEARLKLALSALAATCYNLLNTGDAKGKNILSDATNERFYSSVNGGLEELLTNLSPNCDCWRESWVRAAATFEDHLEDLGAKAVRAIEDRTGSQITVKASLPVGEKYILVEKVFERTGDVEEYTQFLINWEVDAFDARIIQTKGWEDCCKRIIGRMEENLQRSTPWVPALLAEVVMGAPGTVYGWYTSTHWRTGEKLETWEQVLGVLDVVPGEALVKAGIVGLVGATGVVLVKYGTKTIKAAKVLFKVGDEIAGITISRIKAGTNGKYAIIGRKMPDHVEKAASTLQKEGTTVEIFSKEFQQNNLFKIDRKSYNWSDIENDLKKGVYKRDPANNHVLDSEIPKTLMFKANKLCTQKLINEGYTVIDVGYPLDVTSRSLFYDMEKEIIF